MLRPSGVVHRRAHRANLLAGRVLAVLAGHGLEVRAGRSEIALEVGIDAQPLHVAADLHLLLAHHGDIVLRIAARRCRRCSRRRSSGRSPCPRRSCRSAGWEHARRPASGSSWLLALVGEVGILLELFQCGVADDAAGRRLRCLRASCLPPPIAAGQLAAIVV